MMISRHKLQLLHFLYLQQVKWEKIKIFQIEIITCI